MFIHSFIHFSTFNRSYTPPPPSYELRDGCPTRCPAKACLPGRGGDIAVVVLLRTRELVPGIAQHLADLCRVEEWTDKQTNNGVVSE